MSRENEEESPQRCGGAGGVGLGYRSLPTHMYLTPSIHTSYLLEILTQRTLPLLKKTRKSRNITGQSQRNTCNRHLDKQAWAAFFDAFHGEKEMVQMLQK